MHVSPCGWFCFETPVGWLPQDTRKNIMIYYEKSSGSVEISSARKPDLVQEHDVLNLQEKAVEDLQMRFHETSRFQLDNGLDCILSQMNDNFNLTVIAHVFWTHYCISLILETPIDDYLNHKLLDFRNLIQSIETLTTD